VINRLEKAIRLANKIKDRYSNEPEYLLWKREIETTLAKVYGGRSKILHEFQKIIYQAEYPASTIPTHYGTPVRQLNDEDYSYAFKKGLRKATVLLRNLVSYTRDFGLHETTIDWSIIHPAIVSVARDKFNAKKYANSVFDAMKEIELKVKEKAGPFENILFGSKLMQKVFSVNKPLLFLADLNTVTGHDTQNGYLQIFSRTMKGIRNPMAHENDEIVKVDAIHLLYLASWLMHILERARRCDKT